MDGWCADALVDAGLQQLASGLGVAESEVHPSEFEAQLHRARCLPMGFAELLKGIQPAALLDQNPYQVNRC